MSLTLNLSLMFLVFVVFMLLIFFLDFWLYRPMLDFMARRERMLIEGTSKLGEEKERINELHQQAQEVVKKAREEARLIREMANKEAREKYEESFGRARSEVEARFVESKRLFEEQRSTLREELFGNAPLFRQEMDKKIAQMGVAR